MALRDLCRQYGITFKKALGQNLLLDDNINRIMVESAALTREDDVIEVGAGLGALTYRLEAQAGRVLAIEIDRAFMPCLEDQFGDKERVRLFRGDVLNHDLTKLAGEYLPGHAVCKMVSNLPYYITTPILFHFWESSLPVSRIVVMVQEEVALRMGTGVGRSDYGALALAARYYAEVDLVHRVPRTCFRPQPRVDSCIVRLRMRDTPLYPDVERESLFRVIRAAFVHRRKTLRNSISRFRADLSKDVMARVFDTAGIDPGRRPQTLTLDEFAQLTRAIVQER